MWQLLLLTIFATSSAAQIIHWNVSWVTRCPDGVCRPVIGVNGHWPIRPVVVDKGSHYTLRVFNNLNDTTVYNDVQNITIHTHGIDEPGTTYYDGVDGVTQWLDCTVHDANASGIPPGYSFDYRPNLADQVGTYWMHTHVPGSYPDGLRSPLIVRDPDPPKLYKYDTAGVISVSDWVDRISE